MPDDHIEEFSVTGASRGVDVGGARFVIGWSWQQWALGVIFQGRSTIILIGPVALLLLAADHPKFPHS